MADYPNAKMAEKKVPLSAGHTGVVVDSGIEGRGPETKTIRGEGRVGGKKGAGNVGASNVNAA